MRPYKLAVIGAGPSCTYAMERLAATVDRRLNGHALEIHIFDGSGHFGAGQVHSPDQPKTSFLNRIVGQVAFAADESVKAADQLLPDQLRPSLWEWCQRKFAETGRDEFNLDQADWPKRYMHGMALEDLFRQYLGILRANPGVEVFLHAQDVIDLQVTGRAIHVYSTSGDPGEFDEALLVTGHSSNNPHYFGRQSRWQEFADTHPAQFVASTYPLESNLSLKEVPPGTVLACAGMGLTTLDIILYMTEGRGGKFNRGVDGYLQYLPSGDEPSSIAAFSSAGLFTFARPFNAKESDPQQYEHRGVFLTEHAIDTLRANVGRLNTVTGEPRRQLRFEEHILPIVILEMAYVYYRTLLGPKLGDLLRERCRAQYDDFIVHGPSSSDPSELLAAVNSTVNVVATAIDDFLQGEPVKQWPDSLDLRDVTSHFLAVVYGPDRASELTALFDAPAELVAALATAISPYRHGHLVGDNHFAWESSIRPIDRAAYSTSPEYTAVLLDFMDRDHLWAKQDNVHNPAKAAADGVWRDLRQVLAHAIDFGGLEAHSHRQFLEVYMRHHNRLCNGAALEVMEKVHALVREGVVNASFGPGATVEGDAASGKFEVIGHETGEVVLADTLVDARVHGFSARADVRPLFPALLERGVVTEWTNPGIDSDDFAPGGLDLTADFHPVGDDGQPERRLTILGPPSEGVMFFQLGALRPNQDHHVMRDILSWVEEFWNRVNPSAADVCAPEGHEPRLADA